MPDEMKACAVEMLTDEQREIRRLLHEVEMLTNAGVIEVAVRNPSVAEYMKHWEDRATKAEAALASSTGAGASPGQAPGVVEDMRELLQMIDKVQSLPSVASIYGIYHPDSPMAQQVEKLRAALASLAPHGGEACQHEGYKFDKHGHCCPQCGQFLVDFGD